MALPGYGDGGEIMTISIPVQKLEPYGFVYVHATGCFTCSYPYEIIQAIKNYDAQEGFYPYSVNWDIDPVIYFGLAAQDAIDIKLTLDGGVK